LKRYFCYESYSANNEIIWENIIAKEVGKKEDKIILKISKNIKII